MESHPSILAWSIPMDRGARWVTVHGVTKSQTRVTERLNTSHYLSVSPLNKGRKAKSVCLFVFLEIELFFFTNEVISGNLTSKQIKRCSSSGRSGIPTLEILLIPKNLQGNIRLYCSLTLSC